MHLNEYYTPMQINVIKATLLLTITKAPLLSMISLSLSLLIIIMNQLGANPWINITASIEKKMNC
jgi:hypothetical protein